MNDIVINKVQSVQRCISRAREEYKSAGKNFGTDFTRQDAAVLNLLRACEQAIDLANHLIKTRKLGIPNSSSESFSLLVDAGLIPDELGVGLEQMVGFRNRVIHAYQKTDISVVRKAIEYGVKDVLVFVDIVLEMEK